MQAGHQLLTTPAEQLGDPAPGLPGDAERGWSPWTAWRGDSSPRRRRVGLLVTGFQLHTSTPLTSADSCLVPQGSNSSASAAPELLRTRRCRPRFLDRRFHPAAEQQQQQQAAQRQRGLPQQHQFGMPAGAMSQSLQGSQLSQRVSTSKRSQGLQVGGARQTPQSGICKSTHTCTSTACSVIQFNPRSPRTTLPIGLSRCLFYLQDAESW